MSRFENVVVLAIAVVAVSSAAASPVTLIWDYTAGDHIRCVSPIEDMNGDNMPDVLIEIDHTGLASGHLKLMSGSDGAEIWGVSPVGGVSGGCGYGDMCLNTSPDLNGDGKFEALLGTSWGGRTAYAILADEDGAVMWDFDTYTDDPPSGWIYSIDWIPDVTGDGVPDIIFGCGSDNNNAYCVDGTDGSMIWKLQTPDAVYAVARIGDVNGNGTTDVLVATGDTYGEYTYCVDGGSSGIAGYIWRYHVDDSSYCVTGIEDVNGDLIPDAIIGVWDSARSVICASGADGSQIWTHAIGTYVMRVVPIQDLNDDGKMEVLVASWDNAIICLDGRTGNEYWNVPTGSTNGGDVWTLWTLDDVDYDGYDDVIAGSFDLRAYCVSGRTGTVLWDYTVGNRVYSVRGIPDVNGDGIGDAIVGTQYYGGTGGKVFCLDADGDGTVVPEIDEFACLMDGRAVSLSWRASAIAIEGFNVYRAEVESSVPADEFRSALMEDGIERIPEILAARAGGDERGGFSRLNGVLVTELTYRDMMVVNGTRYAYLIGAVHADGSETLAGPMEILVDFVVPKLLLSPTMPNPAVSGLTLEFTAPAGASIAAQVYDLSGRLVAQIPVCVDLEGSGKVAWDGRADDGTDVAAGVYMLRVQAGGESSGRKVVLVR
jgi:outer membrane protein assembly factor BamB